MGVQVNIARAAAGRAFGAGVLVTMTLVLGGCGRSGQHPPSQVVARVDGHEITVSEVNAVLAGMPPVAPAAVPALRKRVIRALVDQQLELDEARALKLDQTPAVLLQMELARRQVLANAYLRRVVDSVSAPSDEAVRRYYDAHPDLFANRKIYQLHELGAQGGGQLKNQIEAELSAGKSVDDIAASLKAKGVPIAVADQTLPAERISLDLLPELASLATGKSLVVAGGGTVRVLELVGAQSQPIDETHARPAIREALLNQARKAAIAQAIQRLAARAKIRYLGSEAPAVTPTPPPPARSAVISKGAAGLP